MLFQKGGGVHHLKLQTRRGSPCRSPDCPSAAVPAAVSSLVPPPLPLARQWPPPPELHSGGPGPASAPLSARSGGPLSPGTQTCAPRHEALARSPQAASSRHGPSPAGRRRAAVSRGRRFPPSPPQVLPGRQRKGRKQLSPLNSGEVSRPRRLSGLGH